MSSLSPRHAILKSRSISQLSKDPKAKKAFEQPAKVKISHKLGKLLATSNGNTSSTDALPKSKQSKQSANSLHQLQQSSTESTSKAKFVKKLKQF